MAAESENGNCNAWASRDPSGVLSPYSFNRRAVQSSDVALKIMYCGVCHADVGWTRNMLNDSKYPLVPGHEIAGIVTQVGADVKGFKVGDHVGVGTYVNSCRDCENCNSFLENHCPKRVFTFNGIDTDGTVTKGGYSTHIVVHERNEDTKQEGSKENWRRRYSLADFPATGSQKETQPAGVGRNKAEQGTTLIVSASDKARMLTRAQLGTWRKSTSTEAWLATGHRQLKRGRMC